MEEEEEDGGEAYPSLRDNRDGKAWRRRSRMEAHGGAILNQTNICFCPFRTFPTANLSSQFLRALPLHFTSLKVSFSFSLVYRRDRVSGGQFLSK